MLDLKHDLKLMTDLSSSDIPLTFHPSSHTVFAKIKQWMERFPNTVDGSFFSDFLLFYLLSTKKYLDHRTASHLFRLVLSVHLMQKKLLHSTTCFPNQRHSLVRGLTTSLFYPFSSKKVLGCLIGFNVMDRYEIYDEENILLGLQKYLPNLKLVKESSYNHVSSHKNLKIFYFEVEKKDGSNFSAFEKTILKNHLVNRVKNSIQLLSPTIFMGMNEEETYKHIITLSQEIDSATDLPQVYISLLQQTGKEITFQIILVYVAKKAISLSESFSDCTFSSKSKLTVRNLDGHPIEAQVFWLHLKRTSSLLRSDGSLDFHSARQKVSSLIHEAIGEFRDYNGGIIVMRQELLQKFKEEFPEAIVQDPELIESFFYSLMPLEKQVVLQHQTICSLFSYFIEARQAKLEENRSYLLKTYQKDNQLFAIIHAESASLHDILAQFLQEQILKTRSFFYNFVHVAEGSFINCVFALDSETTQCLETLKQLLENWQLKLQSIQTLRIALENSAVSLDPRIGGDANSRALIKLLFEGLTRLDEYGNVENALAENIEISSDFTWYIFKLRPSLWNDGTPVTAQDFEYSWKKVLSPSFRTAFAHLFYSIRNAKEAKEGKVSLDDVGIKAVNDRTLWVNLAFPTPYFLQLTADPLYSPVHHLVDQEHPEWPYQSEKNYPCNGPFQLKINQPNQGYQFIKNPHYWDSQSTKLNQISMIQMSSAQAIQSFQRKEIDWIGNPFGVWEPIYNNQKEGHLLSFERNLWTAWFVFNTASLPFQHPKLRQAFAYAIQRAKLIENASLPLMEAYSPIIPRHCNQASFFFPEYDAAKARQLLHEALKELGLRLETFTFNFMYLDKGIAKYTATNLQKQLRECLGVNCILEPLPWSAVFQRMTRGHYQAGLIHWTSFVDDPLYTLNAFRTTSQDINFSKWENSEYKRCIDLSHHEANSFHRTTHLLQAQEILSREMPIIPLFYQPSQAVVVNDLQVIGGSTNGPVNIARSFFNKNPTETLTKEI